MTRVEHSSVRHDWQTPDHVVCAVRQVFGGEIVYDVASCDENPTGAVYFATPERSSLEDHSWLSPWFCNPPYGVELRRKGGWVDKIVEQSSEGIVLVRSSTSSEWFHKLMDWADLMCLVRGRLKFKGAESTAPFPSAVFYKGESPRVFANIFSVLGRVV